MSRIKLSSRLTEARSLAKSGNIGGARRAFAAILHDSPGNDAARAALAALEAETNPPPGALRGLAALLDRGEARAALDQASALLRSNALSAPLWLARGRALQALGQAEPALEAFRRAAALDPLTPEIPWSLGLALQMLGRLPEAETAYRACLALVPGQPEVLANLGVVLYGLRRLEEAEVLQRAALSQAPNRAETYYNLALTLKDLGRIDEAIALNRQALALAPGESRAHNNLALLLQEQGALAEAEAAFRQALACNPQDIDAFRNLCLLAPLAADDPLLQAMERLDTQAILPPAQASGLAVALARVHDRLGDIPRAFALLTRGKALRKTALGYDIAQDQARFAALRATAPTLPALPALPSAAVPVFILGMPRSGTTLVEQILACHPDVTALGEIDLVRRLGADLAQGRSPATPEAMDNFARAYLAQTDDLAQGRPFVTDKTPQNFLFLGLILQALPQARVLHIRRDPAATCWSNFAHHFTSSGIRYNNDLSDVVAYYHLYRGLMNFWAQRLVSVDYDALTEAPEPETRRLIASLGLPWDAACLAPERNPRALRTSSNVQVRQAIYPGSSLSWRRYQAQIGSAFDSLPRD